MIRTSLAWATMEAGMAWVRTCQECGHKQVAQEPRRDKELSYAYTNAKCRKCKSEALDYGANNIEADKN